MNPRKMDPNGNIVACFMAALLFVFVCWSQRETQAGVPGQERDTDSDGIPDAWELQAGLDPNDPRDASLDYELHGHSNLDYYRHGTFPGHDEVGYKQRGLMMPLWQWKDDEIISLLEDRSADGLFFRIISHAYGRHRDYYETNALVMLRAVYDEGVRTASKTGTVPVSFHAALRWLHKLDPTNYPAVAFVYAQSAKTYLTAGAALADSPLSPEEVHALMAAVPKLPDDRKPGVIFLLKQNENPDVRMFFRSTEFRKSLQNPRVLGMVEGALTGSGYETPAQERPTLVKAPPRPKFTGSNAIISPRLSQSAEDRHVQLAVGSDNESSNNSIAQGTGVHLPGGAAQVRPRSMKPVSLSSLAAMLATALLVVSGCLFIAWMRRRDGGRS